MNRNQQLVLNMSASFIAYGVSLFVSFFLSPYIVRTIGVEANGFVGLANNFVSYASLITLALNSLAGRFITISIVKGDIEEANSYFSSVFFANFVIAILLSIAGISTIVFLDKIINVPAGLLSDVRLLFCCLFLNCLVSIVGSVFSVAVFARNMLYLESIRNIEANLARALIIVGLFVFLKPKVWYLGFASLVSGLFVLICNISYTKRLLPEIRVHKQYFSLKKVTELVSSGIWNTINRLGQIFTDGLDLLVTNLLIDSVAMGILSLAKTVPSLISSLMGSIVGVFSPNFTILYAENKSEELLSQIKQSIKIMGMLTNLPIIVLFVCGKDFFLLWQPTQDPRMLQVLSFLTICCLVISGGINSLYGVFTVVNKIKTNSLVVVGCGALSTILTLIALKNTDLGIYAVAGVSSIVSIFRNLFFTVPYGAKCLGVKWYTFYPDVLKSAVYFLVSSAVCLILISSIQFGGWMTLIFKGAIVGVVSLILGFFIVLNKADRVYLMAKLKRGK